MLTLVPFPYFTCTHTHPLTLPHSLQITSKWFLQSSKHDRAAVSPPSVRFAAWETKMANVSVHSAARLQTSSASRSVLMNSRFPSFRAGDGGGVLTRQDIGISFVVVVAVVVWKVYEASFAGWLRSKHACQPLPCLLTPHHGT